MKKLIIFYLFMFLYILPYAFISQKPCDTVTYINVNKGSFSSLDSLIGLEELDSGRYQISFKLQIISCSNGLLDTTMVKEGTTFFFDLNGQIRRIDHYINGELISPFYILDKKQKLKAIYHINKENNISEVSYYKKGHIISNYIISEEHYSKTIFSPRGSLTSNKKYNKNKMYSDSFYKKNGDLKDFIEMISSPN